MRRVYVRLEMTVTDNAVFVLGCVAMLRQVHDEEEPVVAGMNHIFQDNSRSRSDNWSGVALDRDAASSDYDALHAFPSSTSELLFPASSTDHHRLRNRGAAYRIHPAFLHSAPSADRFLPSASADLKLPPATCSNAFRPARISSGGRVPPPSAQHSRAKSRGTPQILSWLFPRSRRKAAKPPESETAASPSDIERENTSRLVTEWGALSLDSTRKELAEANEHRDAALREAAAVRASLGELDTKLASLEAYCSKLKNALRRTTRTTNTNSPSVSRRSAVEPPMPVSHEVMVEGFLQIASEARLSVKELCKALIRQAEGNGLSDKLNPLLRPHRLTLPLPAAGTSSKACPSSSKAVLYHLESAMNKAMYQDFENCAFHRSGAPRCLDPATARRQSFDAFVALRNLSWNEVLRKGTRYYSEDLSRFCDRKMAAVVAALMGWARPWPEQLLQCFFVAAKCVWLLHLLAFSFAPPLTILRVEDGREFDQMYMEDVLHERQPQSPCQVKIMVMPGFYVHDRVLKCRVLTTSTSSEA
jgi:hypothetical protein